MVLSIILGLGLDKIQVIVYSIAFCEPASVANVSQCAGYHHDSYAKGKLAIMTTAHQENTALLTEHFRYTPLVRSTF